MPQTVVFIAAAAVMYTVQPCTLAVHLYCSAWVNSAFHPLWDGNMSICLRAESTGKMIRAVGFEYAIELCWADLASSLQRVLRLVS